MMAPLCTIPQVCQIYWISLISLSFSFQSSVPLKTKKNAIVWLNLVYQCVCVHTDPISMLKFQISETEAVGIWWQKDFLILLLLFYLSFSLFFCFLFVLCGTIVIFHTPHLLQWGNCCVYLYRSWRIFISAVFIWWTRLWQVVWWVFSALLWRRYVSTNSFQVFKMCFQASAQPISSHKSICQ